MATFETFVLDVEQNGARFPMALQRGSTRADADQLAAALAEWDDVTVHGITTGTALDNQTEHRARVETVQVAMAPDAYWGACSCAWRSPARFEDRQTAQAAADTHVEQEA